MKHLQKLIISVMYAAIPTPFVVGFLYFPTTKKSMLPDEDSWFLMNAIIGAITTPVNMIVSPGTFALWPQIFGCFVIFFVISLIIVFDLNGSAKDKNV